MQCILLQFSTKSEGKSVQYSARQNVFPFSKKCFLLFLIEPGNVCQEVLKFFFVPPCVSKKISAIAACTALVTCFWLRQSLKRPTKLHHKGSYLSLYQFINIDGLRKATTKRTFICAINLSIFKRNQLSTIRSKSILDTREMRISESQKAYGPSWTEIGGSPSVSK